jgi:hypothetical protein
MSRTAVAVAVLAIVVGACGSGSSGPKQPGVACTSPNDCSDKASAVNIDGVWAFCCVYGTCASSDSPSVIDCSDANVQLIQASNYDQSCTTDSDCVGVAEGNACYPGFAGCPTATINVAALAQYDNDVASTYANICAALSKACPFELPVGPCCVGGMCQLGGNCPVLRGDAATDVEGGTGSGDAGT